MIPEADWPLDQALRSLQREVSDDLVFARRVAARVYAAPPTPRAELDSDLAPPFPDSADSTSFEAPALDVARDYTPHQSPMSTPMSAEHDRDYDRPSTKHAGLAGLTRSAPPSAALGVGEDSGLIDLKGMMNEPEQPDLLSTSPEIPSARRIPLPPPAAAVPKPPVEPAQAPAAPVDPFSVFDNPFAAPLAAEQPAAPIAPAGTPPITSMGSAPVSARPPSIKAPVPPTAPAFVPSSSTSSAASSVAFASPDVPEDFRRRGGRSKAWLWVSGVVLLVGGAGAAVFFAGQKPTTSASTTADTTTTTATQGAAEKAAGESAALVAAATTTTTEAPKAAASATTTTPPASRGQT